MITLFQYGFTWIYFSIPLVNASAWLHLDTSLINDWLLRSIIDLFNFKMVASGLYLFCNWTYMNCLTAWNFPSRRKPSLSEASGRRRFTTPTKDVQVMFSLIFSNFSAFFTRPCRWKGSVWKRRAGVKRGVIKAVSSSRYVITFFRGQDKFPRRHTWLEGWPPALFASLSASAEVVKNIFTFLNNIVWRWSSCPFMGRRGSVFFPFVSG